MYSINIAVALQHLQRRTTQWAVSCRSLPVGEKGRPRYYSDRHSDLWGKGFFLPQIFHTGSGDLPAPYSVGTGDLSPGVKLPGCAITTHLHLVPMLSMYGAMSPFLNVPSWFAQR